MLIINLSAVEFLTNLLEIIRIIPDLMSTRSSTLEELVNTFMMVTFTGLYIVLYATMTFITVDRLLNIR